MLHGDTLKSLSKYSFDLLKSIWHIQLLDTLIEKKAKLPVCNALKPLLRNTLRPITDRQQPAVAVAVRGLRNYEE